MICLLIGQTVDDDRIVFVQRRTSIVALRECLSVVAGNLRESTPGVFSIAATFRPETRNFTLPGTIRAASFVLPD